MRSFDVSPPPADVADPARLAALRRLAPPDAAADPALQRLARLAARLLGAPTGLVTLIDDREQHFASGHGLEGPLAARRSIPLSHSLCVHALRSGRPLVVPDARNHPLVRDSAAVRELEIGAYCGVPLATEEGHVIGTLCVLDRVARAWTPNDAAALQDLADGVLVELGHRARVRSLGHESAGERRRLYALLDTLALGVLLADSEGRIAEANAEMGRLIGPTALAALLASGRLRAAWTDSGAPLAPEECPVRRAALCGDSTRDEALDLLCADGTRRPVAVSATPVRDAEGLVTGAVAAVTDLSERRRLEAQLQQALRFDATGRLADGVAHELNDTLTTVIGYSEFLRDALEGGDPRRDEVEAIARAADRAAALTRRLLAFGQRQPPELVDVNTVVEDLAPMLRPLLGAAVRLELRLAPESAVVQVDRGRLEQALVGLALAARDAMPVGGAFVVESRRDEAGANAVLVVRDSGVTAAAREGAELGLSSIRDAVTESGGELQVEHEPGAGAAFALRFPLASEAAPSGVRPLISAKAIRGSETILLVEDDPTVRDVATRTLRRQGYVVLEAHDGRAALLLVRRHPGPIHLVISDVIMPDMGGRQLAEELAFDQPEVPILFMSGYTETDIVRRGLVNPRAPFLQKPFLPERLVHLVREVLGRPALSTQSLS